MVDVHAFHMLITVFPSPMDSSLGTRSEYATLAKVADSRVHLDRAKLSSAESLSLSQASRNLSQEESTYESVEDVSQRCHVLSSCVTFLGEMLNKCLFTPDRV